MSLKIIHTNHFEDPNFPYRELQKKVIIITFFWGGGGSARVIYHFFFGLKVIFKQF